MQQPRWYGLVFSCLLLAASAPAHSEPPVLLSSTPGHSQSPALAVAGSEIHVAWQDSTPGEQEIFYRHSDDDGRTWGETQKLTETDGAVHPAIAVAGTNVHVAWTSTGFGKNLFYKRSTDGGDTWSTATALSTDGSNTNSAGIAASGSEVHVVWQDGSIRYTRSLDGGETWSPTRWLRSVKGRIHVFPAIAMAGNTVYVTWQERIDHQYDVMVKSSRNGGRSWRLKRISHSRGPSFDPAIEAAGSNVSLVWSEGVRGGPVIQHRRSLDGGVSWGGIDSITAGEPGVGVSTPAISMAGSEVHAVWTFFDSGDDVVGFRTSPDGGLTWSEEARLTRTRRRASLPVVAAQGSVVHVAWGGLAHGGSSQIFYRRIE